ncbi:VOC family protein [Mariniluteicoccus flavus]
MTIQSLENIGIVVDDLATVRDFFVGLGLTVLGETTVEGGWVDRCVGLSGVRTQVVMLQTPDGHGRLEVMRFLSPQARPSDPEAPANTLGLRRIAFAVDDIDAAVAHVRSAGFALLGEVVQFEEAYRLCYVRGPEGIIVMLSEALSDQ